MGGAAPVGGLEDRLLLARPHAGTVVGDREDHRAVVPGHREGGARPAVRDGVLQERGEHARHQLLLAAHPQRGVGGGLDADPAVHRREHVADLASGGLDLGAGELQQRVHHPGEIAGVGHDRLEGGAQLGGRALPKQRDLRLGAQPGQRGPQLVGDLRAQPPLVPERRGHPVEQDVQVRGELGELVVRWPEREPVVQVPLAPLQCLLGHRRHHPERSRDHPPGQHQHHEQHDGVQQEGGQQGDPLAVLVRHA